MMIHRLSTFGCVPALLAWGMACLADPARVAAGEVKATRAKHVDVYTPRG